MRAIQFISESSTGFDFVMPNKRTIYAYPHGADQSDIENSAGWLSVVNNGDGTYSVGDVTVHKEFRRQGLATAMYKEMAQTGIKIVKSDEVSDMGQSMWAGFNKKGQAHGNKFVTEVERLTPGDYEGGKDSLRGSETKQLKKLPGGSGLKYQVDRRYGCTIELVATNVQTDRPYNHRPWDKASTIRHDDALKKWEANSTGNKVIGRLNMSKVNDFPMPNAYHVNTITVDEDYRGRGLAKALYGIAISELQMNLISGDSQTPGGRQNWVSLAKIPGCEVVGLLSIYEHHIPNDTSGYNRPDDSVVNNLMSVGCDYIGAKGKKHWFYFPIKLSKNELAAKIKHNVKVYHDNYDSGGDWETFLLARWIG